MAPLRACMTHRRRALGTTAALCRKTITVAETIAQVLRAQPRAHILVCAPAPFAADVLASKLVSEHGLSHTQLVRINDPRRDFASVKGDEIGRAHV